MMMRAVGGVRVENASDRWQLKLVRFDSDGRMMNEWPTILLERAVSAVGPGNTCLGEDGLHGAANHPRARKVAQEAGESGSEIPVLPAVNERVHGRLAKV